MKPHIVGRALVSGARPGRDRRRIVLSEAHRRQCEVVAAAPRRRRQGTRRHRGRHARRPGRGGAIRRARDSRPRLAARQIWKSATAWCSISIPARASPGATIVAAAREIRDRLAALEARKLRQAHRRQGHSRHGADRRRRLGHGESLCRAACCAHGRRQPAALYRHDDEGARDGHIFIDYFRNSREATSVAPYSTRARPGAPVSVPVTWERLPRTTGGNEFSVLDLKKRIKEDAWAEIDKVRQKLPEFPSRQRR